MELAAAEHGRKSMPTGVDLLVRRLEYSRERARDHVKRYSILDHRLSPHKTQTSPSVQSPAFQRSSFFDWLVQRNKTAVKKNKPGAFIVRITAAVKVYAGSSSARKWNESCGRCLVSECQGTASVPMPLKTSAAAGCGHRGHHRLAHVIPCSSLLPGNTGRRTAHCTL